MKQQINNSVRGAALSLGVDPVLLYELLPYLRERINLAADHAALVQQGIRDHADWRSKLNFLEADYKAEIARLTAENERLRKAGDAMADTRNKPTTLSEFGHLAMAWFAAKEGKESK